MTSNLGTFASSNTCAREAYKSHESFRNTAMARCRSIVLNTEALKTKRLGKSRSSCCLESENETMKLRVHSQDAFHGEDYKKKRVIHRDDAEVGHRHSYLVTAN